MRLHPRLRRPAARLLALGMLVMAIFLGPASLAWSKPALWVVRSSTSTVYLFGTFHMLPAHTAWRSPTVERALASSQEIWTEADTSTLPALVRLIRRYGLDQRSNLRTALPARYRSRYDIEMSSAGISAGLYGHVKPWLAELLLTGGAMKHARLGYGVEADLIAYAKAHHKTTSVFETADQQFAILADLPNDAQMRALELQIDDFDQTGGQMNQLVRTWLSGDDRRLDALSNKMIQANNERYFDDVIVRRNERFAESIMERLQDRGTAFIAVGAAHLCGSASVQALLRNYGYTAERVEE